MQFHHIGQDDVAPICRLFRDELLREPDSAAVARLVEYPGAVAYGPDGDIAGFCYCQPFAPDVLEVTNLLVLSGYRSQGVGAELLNRVAEYAALSGYRGLIVANSDLYSQPRGGFRSAVPFYLRHGFSVVNGTGRTTILYKGLVGTREADEKQRLESAVRDGLSQLSHYAFSLRVGDHDIGHDDQRVFSGASMIKTFIAGVVSDAVNAGAAAWDMPVTVAEKHIADGDGVLKSMTLPVTMSLEGAVLSMLAMSDNTATNAVVDAFGGTAAVNDELERVGYTASRLRAWVGGHDRDARSDQWVPNSVLPTQDGLSMVTAREHNDCVAALSANPRMKILLCAQADRRSLARHLKPGVMFAHKTGTAEGLRHDGGVLYLPNGETLSVTILTDGDERDERVDDPACVAMGRAMRNLVEELGHTQLLA